MSPECHIISIHDEIEESCALRRSKRNNHTGGNVMV
jgi:hypothetical protein